jgi:hypothetical protein
MSTLSTAGVDKIVHKTAFIFTERRSLAGQVKMKESADEIPV